jgi:nucleoside-diphosphate-sugar epimerase
MPYRASPLSQKRNKLIVYTGGTGFLGVWTLKELLERSFTVRVAIRSESKAEHIRNVLKEHADRLEFTIVDDITRPGAFDEAVKGVDGIIHSASPLSSGEPGLDPSLLIEPAVNGTIGIIKSALKSPTVQRIVVTSSIMAIWGPKPSPSVYTEVRRYNIDRQVLITRRMIGMITLSMS